ncbi:MAG: tRNA (adenosine(37)-N6)-dimethylallyltransferase MiaA [Planctomycetales bacterium]|nr:tRNA (adenosine(37)-N6)-dimethylallyltransferase MiaA [Planctomycetales bacterium]
MIIAQECWFLTGPTASGKTAVAVSLAREIGAEIVSMDSMALYRGMDIGTAKPTQAEREAVPHHLIDVTEPSESYSVARYRDEALAAAERIQARGREVLFVGGTPLYLKALLRGLFEGPEADWELRRSLEADAASGQLDLHAELAQFDPVAAERLHANDTRRLIRAIEVYRLTGTPISQLQREFERAHPAQATRVFELQWPRHELNRRIDSRVETMFAAGLVAEVQALLADRARLSRTARQALGYREVIAHLEGRYTWDETVELMKTHTRQFARRQLTWFRSLPECRPVTCTAGIRAEEVGSLIRSMVA